MDCILLTGASGYLGGMLALRLAAEKRPIVLAGRKEPARVPGNARFVAVDGLNGRTDWREALRGCGTIVHFAAQVPSAGITEETYSEVNDRGTARLVEQARDAGIRTMVMASSIAAITGATNTGVLDDGTAPAPQTAYGRSKLAAETHIAEFARSCGTGIALRLPLVYGSEARGNWRHLMRLAATGLPLPFGAAHGRRSIIADVNVVGAVAYLLERCDNPASGAYAVTEGDALSLAEIMTLLRAGIDRPPRLVAFPPKALDLMLRAAGKGGMSDSLLGNLVVDGGRFLDTFGWKPIYDSREGIRACAAAFAQGKSRPDGP